MRRSFLFFMIIYLCTGALLPLGAEEIIVRREVIKGPGIHSAPLSNQSHLNRVIFIKS